LTSGWRPDVMPRNHNVRPAGQTAGFPRTLWEPERFGGDPAAPDYHIEGLSLTGDLTPVRMDRRRDLREQIERHFGAVERGGALDAWDRLSQQAFDLVTSGKARAAFDLRREPDPLRRPHRHPTLGPSCPLARPPVQARRP